MRKINILAVAAGFVAAAGITTAGNVVINGTKVGETSQAGDVALTLPGTFTASGSSGGDGGGDTLNCGNHATPSNGQCVCWSGYEYEGGNTAPEGADCTLIDSGGGDTGGGGGGGDAPADCNGVGVGSGWTRKLEYSGFSSFPPTSGLRNEYGLRKNEYFSIKFTVPSVSQSWGLLGWDGRPGATNAVQTYAFSKCPGDFADAVVKGGICKKGNTASGSLYFASSDSTYGGSSWLCTLQAGETYYLNIAYGQGSTNSSFSNTCPDSSCGAYFDWKTN